MLNELLAKWAELEPDRCQSSGPDKFLIRGGAEFLSWQINQKILIDCFGDLAHLQRDVQNAITSRDLRCKLENSKDIWFAEVLSPNKPQQTEGSDLDAAIALLKAYVSWLEREVANAH